MPLLVLLGLFVVTHDRPFLGVGIAAAAVLFWQFAVPIALFVWAAAIGHREDTIRVAVGGAAVGIAVVGIGVLPFVLIGAGEQLLVQTVLFPVLMNATQQSTLLYYLLSYFDNWILATAFVWIAIGGWLLLAMQACHGADSVALALAAILFWLVFGGALFGQTATLDMQPVAPFVALGVGIAIGALPDVPLSMDVPRLQYVRVRSAVTLGIVLVAVVAWIYWAAFPPYEMVSSDVAAAYLGGEMPSSCTEHVNYLGTQYRQAVPWDSGTQCAGMGRFLEWLRM